MPRLTTATPCLAPLLLLAVAVSAWPAAAAVAGDSVTAADTAKAVARPPGFPRPSAVCFSSRWKHPSGSGDPHDTFAAAAAFHATGFYWTNGPNQEYFREIKQRGYWVQGWLSTILPDTVFGNTREKGRILNSQGEPIVAPWMSAPWGRWGCLNSPDYRRVYLEYVRMYLDAGVDSLHMDDPAANAVAVRWGGCHCPACRDKAAQAGKPVADIQLESTAAFYGTVRAEMDAYAKRHVPFSCNSHPGGPGFVDDAFDFGLEELDAPRPYSFRHAVRVAEARGKAQMYTLRSDSVPVTRRTIALAYACGSHIIVPWDVYLPGGQARYFGRPDDYADLYGFARAVAPLLDGYEEAAFLLAEAPDERYGHAPVAVAGGSGELSLFVRALPGQAAAPAVVHVLDAADQPKPFRLRFRPARFFGDRPVAVDLLRPAPYDRAAHDMAERKQDFGPLSVRQRLAAGYANEVEIPALSPWGVVVVAPEPGAASGVWPPSILADDRSAYASTLSVTIDSPTPGAVLRCTLDGTDPDATAPRYRGPIVLTDRTTVKARAFVDGATSTVATASFRRVGPPRAALAPNAVPGLCLWVKADDLLASTRAGDPVTTWPAQAGPDLVVPPVTLANGRAATAPALAANAIGGRPVVRFGSGTDLLAARGFADQYLRGAFTVLMVNRAEDPYFGLCGNALNGNGGVPRLYVMRNQCTYNASSVTVGAPAGQSALLAFTHDGTRTVAAYLGGRRVATASGPEYEPVAPFGSGGHLAIPFWCGNEYHAGDLAELLVFSRLLSDEERHGVEQYLAETYGLRATRQWEAEP